MSRTAHSLTLRRGPGTSILGKWNEQGSWQSTAVPRILQLGWNQDQQVEFGHVSCFICFYPGKKHPLLKNVNGKHPPSTATSFRPSRGARQGVASLEGAAWLICIQTEKGIQKPGMILIIFWHQNYQFWFKNIPSINFEDSKHFGDSVWKLGSKSRAFLRHRFSGRQPLTAPCARWHLKSIWNLEINEMNLR